MPYPSPEPGCQPGCQPLRIYFFPTPPLRLEVSWAHPCWRVYYGLYKCLCNPIPCMIPSRRHQMACPASSPEELVYNLGTVASETLPLACAHDHTLEIPMALSRATLFCHQPQSGRHSLGSFFMPINYEVFFFHLNSNEVTEIYCYPW